MEDNVITLTKDGDAESDWWAPKMADVFCQLCGGDCKDEEVNECPIKNPFCG